MDLNFPTYILHYENYETRYKATVRELVNFLELPSRGDLIGFIRGKEYRHYYTTDERMVIREAVQALSLAVTWENLSHYFVE